MSNRKFVVSYSLPYTHTVSVGVTAPDEAGACAAASAAFDEGTIWDDTPEMPLLYDDYEEVDGAALVFDAVSAQGSFQRDASVAFLQRRERAIKACKALVAAYAEGMASGGSVPWEGVDEAYRIALTALGLPEASNSVVAQSA